MQASYTKARNLFVNTLKGKEDKLKQAIAKGVKHKAINGLGELGELGAVTAALVTAALGFITSILGFFKGKKNPATGETYTDENVTEGQVRNLMNQSEQYDEDGYIISPSPVNTTAQPAAEQTFWQKAGNFVNNIKENASNIVSNFLPQGGNSYLPAGGGYEQYDEYEQYEEPLNQQNMIISPAQGNSSAVTASIQTGGMMSNIGNFIKKNAVMLGIGAVGIAGAIYLMNRKKKSGKGLSGVGRRKCKTTKTPLKAIELS
jgi:hypothetical protein